MKNSKKEKSKSAKECKSACAKKTSIGGQALIEGIMMRGPQRTAMAVRNPQGEIVLEEWDTVTKKRPKILKLPIIRGVVGFVDSLTMGYKALMRSADISLMEEVNAEIEKEKAEKEEKKKAKQAKKLAGKGLASTDEAAVQDAQMHIEENAPAEASDNAEESTALEAAETGANETSDIDTKAGQTDTTVEAAGISDKKEKKEGSSSALMTGIMIIATVLGVAMAVILFITLPSFIYSWTGTGLWYLAKNVSWMNWLMPAIEYDNLAVNSLIKSAFEGFLKIAILVAYMALVSRMKEIKRTFQYHGAEHKTIFCYESAEELTVENVRKQRRFHPRCGTAFLVLMLIVGMFVSFLIDPIFYFTIGRLPHILVRVAIKLLTLPLVMGIGYELIKIAGRHDNLFTRIMSAPGLWLQRLTVLEPTDDMIECAITAFVKVIPEDNSDNY